MYLLTIIWILYYIIINLIYDKNICPICLLEILIFFTVITKCNFDILSNSAADIEPLQTLKIVETGPLVYLVCLVLFVHYYIVTNNVLIYMQM